jgi:hypothetical protein
LPARDYETVVQPWLAKNRADLMRVWKSIREQRVDEVVVARLQGSTI